MKELILQTNQPDGTRMYYRLSHVSVLSVDKNNWTTLLLTNGQTIDMGMTTDEAIAQLLHAMNGTGQPAVNETICAGH